VPGDLAQLAHDCTECAEAHKKQLKRVEANYESCIASATTVAESHCRNGYRPGQPKGAPIPEKTNRVCGWKTTWKTVLTGVPEWTCWNSATKTTDNPEFKSCVSDWVNGRPGESTTSGQFGGEIALPQSFKVTYAGKTRTVTVGARDGYGQACFLLQEQELADKGGEAAACREAVNDAVAAAGYDDTFVCKHDRDGDGR
jgi:hypothetical protein